MRVLIAFDKFKDSLTARQACDVAARTLRGLHPDWRLDLCPLADGGDGFAEILTQSAGGQLPKFPVTGPRGGMVEAVLGLVALDKVPAAARAMLAVARPGETVAVIEMAAASGLALLPSNLRDPWQATTHGTGQLIRIASELGAVAIVLGVGGSATHDLGLGALSALGLEFRAAEGMKLRPPLPAHWMEMARIEGEVFRSIPPIRIACDVSNPLLGPRGAAAVYGPQKGLIPEDLERLESATAHAASLLCDHCEQPRSLMKVPGTGAAGGISFGLMAAAHAQLLPGFELVSSWLDLDARLAAADLVLTGEGRFDESSLEGKGPGAVAARARALGRPLRIFAGQITAQKSPDPKLELHEITPPGTPLPQALREGSANLAAAVRRAFEFA